MRKFSCSLITFITFLFLLEGCAPSKPVIEERVISADRLVKKLEANRRKIKVFQGTGVLSINSSEVNAKSNFEVIIKKPDSLRVSFYGPFGIDLAHALITPKNFLFYDVINNTVYRGLMKSGIIKQILKIELPLNEVVDALVGSVNLTDKLRIEPNKYELLDGSFKMIYVDSSLNLETIYLVDENDLSITETQLKKIDGKLIMLGKFTRFSKYEDVPIPLEINLEDLANKQKLKVEYRKIEVNQSSSNLKLEIPSDVKIREW